jgi:hypothetical protein
MKTINPKKEKKKDPGKQSLRAKKMTIKTENANPTAITISEISIVNSS